MRRARRRPNRARPRPALWFGLGVTVWLAWPACGGQSIRYEEDPDETPGVGGTGFGANTGGGVAGTDGFGGSSIPSGGVGDFPNGGDGIGAVPSGGNGAQGGVGPAGTGFGGVGASGAGNGGLGGAAGVFGTGGLDVGGVGGRGRGMGGRFGGGRFGGRGQAGRGAGGGGMGGFSSNPLDGFTFRTPCTADTVDSYCYLRLVCPNADPSLPGIHSTDVTVTMPGTPGVFYDIGVRVQGLVESKTYSGGLDQDGYASIIPADGFYSGGAPALTPASVYLVRVSSPAHDYYLNSISPPTMSSVAPPTWVDYRATIRVEGGTTVRLVSADSDCAVLRNCGTPASSTDCSPVTVMNLLPGIADDIPTQPYNGQFVGMVVDSVTAL